MSAVSAAVHLTEARFNTCPKLVDVSALAGCSDLELIWLNHCKQLSSISFMAKLPSLKEVRLVGSTVADGQMAALIGVEVTVFDDRKHYSHRRREVEAATRKLSGDSHDGSLHEVGGADLDIDLETHDPEIVHHWASRLPALLAAARKRLADDPGESGLLYAEHHIAEIEPEAWESVHGLKQTPSVNELLALLQPVSLWGDPAECLHLDFTIGEELTQYVLSFEVHPDGTLGDIDMES